MAHSMDSHDPYFIGDFVNHPIITSPNAPIVLAAREFPASGWARIFREGLDGSEDALFNSAESFAKAFSAARSIRTLYMTNWIFVQPRMLPTCGMTVACCEHL